MGIGGLRAHHCRIATKQKRAESPLSTSQPASDHRRVLAVYFYFSSSTVTTQLPEAFTFK
jgi:hypothetical protein